MTHHQIQFPAQASSNARGEKQEATTPATEQQPVAESNEAALFTADDVVHVYTRAQALADGVLVDVTETAREAGFRLPVALTRAAWADCVEWTEVDAARRSVPQDEAGRLWDVLWMAFLAARRARGGDHCLFDLRRVPREGRGNCPRRVSLAMHIGPGDAGEPVITIMQPHED